MGRLTISILIAAFAAALLVPSLASACMRDNTTAQTPATATVAEGAGTTTTPYTPAPETKTGG